MSRQASCTGTFTAGGGVGNTTTVTGITSEGRIVQGNTAVLAGPPEPLSVETQTTTTPSNVTTTTYRICLRSRVESKVPPK